MGPVRPAILAHFQVYRSIYPLATCPHRTVVLHNTGPLLTARPSLYSTRSDSHDDLRESDWPTPTHGRSVPTPYQIFNVPRGAPYGKSKSRFYRLVKLYHPDKRSCHPSKQEDRVSDAVRLERYRLIVAAHDILSDPTKRDAYDRFGAGWAGRAEVGTYSTRSRDHDPGIWSNATWEDWERWRDRAGPGFSDGQKTGGTNGGFSYTHARHGRRSAHGNNGSSSTHPGSRGASPLQVSNSYFASIVLMLALLGSMANYSRADHEGTKFLAARDVVHDRTSRDLRRTRQELAGLSAKDERIDFFVRAREASFSSGMSMDLAGGLAARDKAREDAVERIREEKVRRLLPSPEACGSATTAVREGGLGPGLRSQHIHSSEQHEDRRRGADQPNNIP